MCAFSPSYCPAFPETSAVLLPACHPGTGCPFLALLHYCQVSLLPPSPPPPTILLGCPQVAPPVQLPRDWCVCRCLCRVLILRGGDSSQNSTGLSIQVSCQRGSNVNPELSGLWVTHCFPFWKLLGSSFSLFRNLMRMYLGGFFLYTLLHFSFPLLQFWNNLWFPQLYLSVFAVPSSLNSQQLGSPD